MSDHFISLSRGEQGFTPTDFATGTASTVGDDMELRIHDGANLTKKDVHIALQAFIRFFENAQLVGPAGFDVKG